MSQRDEGQFRAFGIMFVVMGIVFVVMATMTVENVSRINGNINEVRAEVELMKGGFLETEKAIYANCGNCSENKTVFVDREFETIVEVQGEWQVLLRSFAANHTYDRYNYNCVDYSRDAVTMLREHGYEAYQVAGHCMGENYNDSGQDNHAWVELRLWVEPQDGSIINASDCSKNM